MAFLPKDVRETIPDYAKSHNIDLAHLQDVLSPSGYFDCKTKVAGKNATASLVISNRVLVTNNHIICDAGNEKNPIKPSQCTFKYFDFEAKKTRVIATEKFIAQGATCVDYRSGASDAFDDDWVVAILKQPATGAKPYQVRPFKAPPKVLKVHAFGYHASDFCAHDGQGRCILNDKVVQPKDRRYYLDPPFFEDCTIRGWSQNSAQAYAQFEYTDCASSHGASGGPVLDWDLKEPTLNAIIAKEKANKDEAHQEVMTGEPVLHDFHVDYEPNDPIRGWYVAVVPLDGPFLAAVKKAAKQYP